MASESIQHRLQRVRRRLIRPTYDVAIGDAIEVRELPFVVGVLADLSGTPVEPLPPLRDRSFVGITICDFSIVFAGMMPRLIFQVQNTLNNEGSPLDVELLFQHMGDFDPDAVARQIEPLRKLVEARNKWVELLTKMGAGPGWDQLIRDVHSESLEGRDASCCPAVTDEAAETVLPNETFQGMSLLDRILASDTAPTDEEELQPRRMEPQALEARIVAYIARIDQALSEQLSLILHHPEFRRLEASWRGLHYLLHSSCTGATLKIKVLNVRKEELLEDAKRAVEFDQTILFKKVYEEEFGVFGGHPYGVLVGDYEFGHGDDDLTLLKSLSRIAAAAHAPFLAAASPRLLGCDSFLELARFPRSVLEPKADDHPAWRTFRETEQSRYVGLCLPRILLRLPYGPDQKPIGEFNFVEDVTGPDRSKLLWGNPAYALAARLTDSFDRTGFCMAIRGVEGGGLVESLPRFHIPSKPEGLEGDEEIGPAEFAIPDPREAELSNLGFIPLMNFKGSSHAAFFSVPSCQKAKVYHEPNANVSARVATWLPYTFLASRFAHYLMVMTRVPYHHLQMTREEIAQELNNWIAQYVRADDCRYPLQAARIDVMDTPGRPGGYQAVVLLRPHWEFGELTAVRAVVDLPPCGR